MKLWTLSQSVTDRVLLIIIY